MTLYRIETGQTASKWTIVAALCEYYGTDAATRTALIEMAKASRDLGWFERYGDAVPQTLGMYLGAEQNASGMHIYDPEIIPGNLQTIDYVRAVFDGEGDLRHGSEPIETMLAARAERQQRFWGERPDGAVLCVVLGEAAVTRQLGGRATMRQQVEHLRELDGQRGTEIRILTWSAGGHPAIYGGYTIFDFPDPEDPTVVYVENYRGGEYLEDVRTVTRMGAVQRRTYDLATPIKEYTQA